MDKNKLHAVIEVLILYFLLDFIAFLFSFTSIAHLQEDILYWNYFITILSALIPVCILIVFKRRFKSYGLHFKNARWDILWSLIFVFLIIIPSLITIMFGFASFDITKSQPQYFISTLIFQMIFTGLCEEIYFRGYIQSRLNEDFDHPYVAENIKFGPGVIIAAVLFGFGHVINPFRMIIGIFDFNIFSGLFAAQFGMLIGLIREKTGNILIPILIHGLYNGFVSFFSGLSDLSQTITIGLGFLIAWIFLFIVFIRKYKIERNKKINENEQLP